MQAEEGSPLLVPSSQISPRLDWMKESPQRGVLGGVDEACATAEEEDARSATDEEEVATLGWLEAEELKVVTEEEDPRGPEHE